MQAVSAPHQKRKILIMHQNFPGQFDLIARALRARGDEVVTIGGPTARPIEGIPFVRWTTSRGSTKDIYYQAVRAEADLIRGTAAAQAAEQVKQRGFLPDLIIAHPAWGETIHLNLIYPDVPQLLFGELYYQPRGLDSDFDPEFGSPKLEQHMRVTAKNAGQSLAFSMASRIICPTPFQASTFPPVFRPLISVLHEGIDATRAARRPAKLELSDGRSLDGSKPVITFINRRFEPLRGFHVFMRALPAFLDACPDAEVVLIGEEQGVSYGATLPGGEQWKARMLAEVGDRLDLSRVHFLGRVDHARMVDALSISWGHVYYTYPFVLSWSLLEAMACECLILGSDTAPVRDAVEHGRNGLLFDFFDINALSNAMIRAAREPASLAPLRKAARQTVLDRFDSRTTGLPGWLRLIDETLIDAVRPPSNGAA